MKNKLVGMLVAIFAFIFVAAYILVFGSNPTSTDPEDWAYFATYLSGTVGVTAVLGTLYAVVRTLGHQQELIDSQNEIIRDQKKLISFSEQQLQFEKRKREVDLAYDNIKSLLPMMIDYIEVSLNEMVMPTESMKVVIRDRGQGYSDYIRKDLFEHANRITNFLNEDTVGDVESYANMTLGPVIRTHLFLFQQLKVSPELFNVVDCQLDKRFARPLRSPGFYMLCVMAYYSGLGDDEFCEKGKRFLNMQTTFEGEDRKLVNWYELGVRIKKLNSAQLDVLDK